MSNHKDIAVIDLFAGPGGLGEGFSAYKSRGVGHPFHIALSVEMEKHAHRTLQLRSFYRQYTSEGSRVPESFYKVLRGTASYSDLASGRCATKWQAAEHEAIRAELGTTDGNEAVDKCIQDNNLTRTNRPVVLLGGPPCQAYSLVGRARNKGINGYKAEDDGRHILYKQYLRILCQTWPVAFVMENVKGILSSKLNGSTLFPRILEDLREPERSLSPSSPSTSERRYILHTLTLPASEERGLWSSQYEDNPASFIVRTEQHGIPQRRHRVFVVGIREDIKCSTLPQLIAATPVSLASVIGELPSLHPRVSNRCAPTPADRTKPVLAARQALRPEIIDWISEHHGADIAKVCKRAIRQRDKEPTEAKNDFHSYQFGAPPSGHESLFNWLRDPRLKGVANHIAKSHMPSDLARYVFASAFASRKGYSPKLAEFPKDLLPSHANVPEDGQGSVFADRFRVQTHDEPATTITSHIAKDGHYYIHPDPMQMRSLTVREAARIQTFPDNYYFCGPRTAQYQQVGNAVPPYLAHQIAEVLHSALNKAGL